MEKIKILEQEYEIQSINPVSAHVLEIVFAAEVPEEYGDIDVFTSGGIQCAHLPGYGTVYKQEGQTVQLSDDGSVYTEPVFPDSTPDPEPYVPTLEEVVAAKKQEINAACEKTIYAGIDVVLADGSTEHFSLSEHDQLNLFGNQTKIAAGATEVEYHCDGKPCNYYSVEDMQNIINRAMFFVSYNTTYCNSITTKWLPACKSIEEVQAISYGVAVPEEYQSDVLKAYILQIASMEGGADGTETVG